MINSRWTDALCALIVAAALLVTLLFLNGKALGITASGGDALEEDAAFTQRDLDAGWDEDESTVINFSDDAITLSSTTGAYAQGNTAVIVCAGTYILRGSLSNGQIMINSSSSEEIHLVLDGVDIYCEDSAPLYVTQADKVFLTLADGSENTLSCGETFSQEAQAAEVTSAVFCQDDLTINGSGSLTVSAPGQHGIVSKDDLKVTGGSLAVTAAEDGLRGRDSVAICGGTFTLDAGGDGIQSSHDEDSQKGTVLITGGTFQIAAGNDGIQAETILTIEDGTFAVTTGGGAQDGVTTGGTQEGFFGGMGLGGPVQDGQRHGGTDSTAQGGEAPQSQTDLSQMAPPDGADGTDRQQHQKSAEGSLPEEQTVNQPVPETTSGETTSQEDTAESSKALKAGSLLEISGGTFQLSAYDDAIHSDGDICISGGALTLSSSNDAVHAENALTVSDGSLTVTECFEGLEACHILISGGETELFSADDGVNATDGTQTQSPPFAGTTSSQQSSDTDSQDTPDFRMTGGSLHICITGDADGIDSNGSVFIEGGTISVSGSSGNGNGGLDYGDSGQNAAYISGGIVVITGGSGMASTFDESSEQCSILYNFSEEAQTGDLISLSDTNGNLLVSFAAENAFTSVVVSSPQLTEGKTYTLTIGDTSVDVEMSSRSVTAGTASPAGFAGGPSLREGMSSATPSY